MWRLATLIIILPAELEANLIDVIVAGHPVLGVGHVSLIGLTSRLRGWGFGAATRTCWSKSTGPISSHSSTSQPASSSLSARSMAMRAKDSWCRAT